MQFATEDCIRCDDPVMVDEPGDYVHLTFNQEVGALPICNACFEDVRGRDLWASH